MGEEHGIVRMVYRAKADAAAADELIDKYMNFIRSETVKFTHCIPSEGREDELSIAMFAFYEAVQGYERRRGSFLAYAAVSIRNRLIDYTRREARHRQAVSFDAPLGDGDDSSLSDLLPAEDDGMRQWTIREATKEELEEYRRDLSDYGITLGEVADNCPKQDRTLKVCHKALEAAKQHPEILEHFIKSKRLPLAELIKESGVSRKTLERHRTYMAAILLAYTNGYEIIRGHLCQVTGRKEADV